jgi:hypothetical protein
MIPLRGLGLAADPIYARAIKLADEHYRKRKAAE